MKTFLLKFSAVLNIGNSEKLAKILQIFLATIHHTDYLIFRPTTHHIMLQRITFKILQ